jgi:hypothetical protein
MVAIPFLIGALVLVLLIAVASCRRGERPAAVAPAAEPVESEGSATDPWASDTTEYTGESTSDAEESAALPEDSMDESAGGEWGEKDAAPEETYEGESTEPSDDYGEPSYDAPAEDDAPIDDTWEG